MSMRAWLRWQARWVVIECEMQLQRRGVKFVKAWENRRVVMRLRLLMSLWPCSLYLCVVETAVIQRL